MADSKTAAQNGIAPEFDFSQVKRKWDREWNRLMVRATKLQAQVQEAEAAGLGAAAIGDVFDELENIGAAQEAMLADVLVHVPADWLHGDAPKKPDWSAADFDEWLLIGSYEKLIKALQEARLELGNSAGRSSSM